MASAPLLVEEAFLNARKDFLRTVKNPDKYNLTGVHSIKDVYDMTDKIQEKQAATKTLRGLKRIEPFINGLKEYAAVIEVFIQAKADVLSLIWGPLKLVLQMASSTLSAFENVSKLLADIGHTLPLFQKYAILFDKNSQVNHSLYLFYLEILELYKIVLDFLSHRHLNVFIESVWPNVRQKISVVQSNMNNHKGQMSDHVTWEDRLQANQARKRALEEYDKQQTHRDHTRFYELETKISPQMYDDKLGYIIDQSVVDSGLWLEKNPDFKKWLDITDISDRRAWLHGIPGSGKTFLTANIARRLRDMGNRVSLIFLANEDKASNRAGKVLQSLLFQILRNDPSAIPILLSRVSTSTQERELRSNTTFAKNLLCDILQVVNPSFVLIDGIDEAEEFVRCSLLDLLIEVLDQSVGVKLLLSSRRESDIEQALSQTFLMLRVDHENSGDIRSYAAFEHKRWLKRIQRLKPSSEMLEAIKSSVTKVMEKSQGMFLYTKLMLRILQSFGSPRVISAEVHNLPDGLDEAYGRVLLRLKTGLLPPSQQTAHKILQWIACANRPLREAEILQILVIKPDADDFDHVRKECQDIMEICGPIIEERQDAIYFVHFSVKEYLLGKQSAQYLCLKSAHLAAAITCSTYLAFDSLDSVFKHSDEEGCIEGSILRGDLVFFDYAATQWLQHIKLSCEESQAIDTLARTIAKLDRIRTGVEFQGFDTEVPEGIKASYEALKGFGDLQNDLAQTDYLLGRIRHGFQDIEEVGNAQNMGVVFILAVRRVRTCLENLVCPDKHTRNCTCDTLNVLFGNFEFHCPKFACVRHHKGFPTREERERHVAIHGLRKPGIESSPHFGQCQDSTVSNHVADSTDKHSPLSDSEYKQVLMACIRSNNLIVAEQLMGKHPTRAFGFVGQTGWQANTYFLQTISAQSTTEMLSYVLKLCKSSNNISSLGISRITSSFLAGAIEGENSESIKICLSNGAQWDQRIVMNDLTTNKRRGLSDRRSIGPRVSNAERILGLLNFDLLAYVEEVCGSSISTTEFESSTFFQYSAVIGKSSEDIRQSFEQIETRLKASLDFSEGVRQSILRGSSAQLQACLESGGNPNASGRFLPLYHVVKSGKGSPKTKMIELLLEFGADPYPRRGKDIRKLAGMKQVEKYYGENWDTIVARFQKKQGG